MGLFRCRNRTASNSDVMCALDSGSQESYDLGELLRTTYRDPVAKFFRYARHIANFTTLEVRGDLCGRGLGIQVGKHLIATIQNRFDVGVTILKPFPLQYT